MSDSGLGPWTSHVSIRSERTVELGPSLYGAYVEIDPDDRCPHGVFRTSAAVDVSEEAALRRARFEAVERYCLAAIGWHRDRMRPVSNLPPGTVVRPDFEMADPFGRDLAGGMALAAHPMHLEDAEPSWVRCGDVFAPFPLMKGQCSLPPSTNGAALGQDLEMARERALLELLERDCVMSFWYREGALGGRTVPAPFVAGAAVAQIAFLEDLGYETRVLEVSRFAGTRVALAFARQRDGHFPYAACSAGIGAARQSVLASINELVQTVLATASAGPAYSRWAQAGMPLASVEHNMWWYATPRVAAPVLERLWPRWDALDAAPDEDDVTLNATEIVRSAGIDCFAVEITPPPLAAEVSCVRAVSPTLWPLVVSEEHGPRELVADPARCAAPHPFP